MESGWPSSITFLLVAGVAGLMVVACLRSLVSVLQTAHRVEGLKDDVQQLAAWQRQCGSVTTSWPRKVGAVTPGSPAGSINGDGIPVADAA
ncbi:MAG: hypothetical protein ACYTGR_10275 [Planctomycetota bacterium]